MSDFLDTNKLVKLVSDLKLAGLKELDFTTPEGHFKLIFSDSVPLGTPEQEIESSDPAVVASASIYDRLNVKDFG